MGRRPRRAGLHRGVYILVGLLVVLCAHLLARALLKLGWLAPSHRRATLERRQTLEALLAGPISPVAMVLAIVASLSPFVPSETLIWIVGLFSAAFGFGARGLVADFLAGGSCIFQNTFAIGKKVEFYSVVWSSGWHQATNVADAAAIRPYNVHRYQ